MDEIEHAARAVHHVEVELARKPFPKLQRELVEMRIGIEVVVRADDRRVAARVAAAKPALLQHGDIADAVLPREVVRRRKTVASATDNDRVVLLFRRWTAPCARPVRVTVERAADEREDRIAFHRGGARATLTGSATETRAYGPFADDRRAPRAHRIPRSIHRR